MKNRMSKTLIAIGFFIGGCCSYHWLNSNRYIDGVFIIAVTCLAWLGVFSVREIYMMMLEDEPVEEPDEDELDKPAIWRREESDVG